MTSTTVVTHNRSQAIRSAAELRRPDKVNPAAERTRGCERSHEPARREPPMGQNDWHIVGHAHSEGLTLACDKRREFERVDARQLANWIN